MKKVFISKFLLALMLSVSLIGCGSQAPQAKNSSEAIEQASSLKTPEEKAKYLISQANTFVNSEKFDEAINTAKFVLTKIDQDSTEAKSILTQAQEKLATLAQQKVEELKKDTGKAMDDVKGKLGSFGK